MISGNVERTRGRQHARVEARQLDIDAVLAQELDRGEMQSVERADGDRKRLKRAGETLGTEFEKVDAAEQLPHRLVRARKPAGVDSIPDLVFEQLT